MFPSRVKAPILRPALGPDVSLLSEDPQSGL